MKKIKKGDKLKNKTIIVCHKCESTFSYKHTDIWQNIIMKFVVCPYCGVNISIKD